jgi:hypothetical protein
MKGQFIPKYPHTLFHSTSTGNNNKNIKSFLKRGISISDSRGHGQGRGFYLWTTRRQAIKHLKDLQKNKITSSNDFEGYMMIVKINAHLDPKKFDLDAEDNGYLIVRFLHDHFELFQQIEDNKYKIDDNYLVPSRCKKYSSPDKIVFMFSKEKNSLKKKSICIGANRNNSSIREGMILGQIYSLMQKLFSRELFKFEVKCFEKFTTQGLALKYVSSDLLKVEAMYAYVNKKWIDAKNLLVIP